MASTIVVMVLAIEILLRLWPEMLGQEFANKVLSKYTIEPGGIYYHDPSLKMLFMKQNFVTENYWNEYRWRHETDELGFRNSQTRTQADILLIGDSLIYGHGVNIEETVGVLLEQHTAYSVVNMGAQGHCAFQETYLVAQYPPKFGPRYVFYFFFDNDIEDLYAFVTDQEIKEFIERDPSDLRYEMRTDPSTLIRQQTWWDVFRPRLYVSRAFDLLLFSLHVKKRRMVHVPKDPLHDVDNEQSLAWLYTKHAILSMNAVAQASGTTFIIVPIVINKKPYYDILQRYASLHGLRFLDQARVYDWDATHFLPGDGHFSRTGANAMAQILSDYLKTQEDGVVLGK